MKAVGEIISNLPVTQGHSDAQEGTRQSIGSKISGPLKVPDVTPEDFEILHPQHRNALEEIATWGSAILAQENSPRWLTLLGHWGCGKTMMVKHLHSLFKTHGVNCHFKEWVFLLGKIKAGDWDFLRNYKQPHVLIVDDFGKDGGTNFAREKLFDLMQRRERKWTLFLSNLSLEEVAEKLDGAIASRLLRHGSRVIKMDKCPDYWLEKAKEERRTK